MRRAFFLAPAKTCSLSVYHTWLKPSNPTTEHFQREISVRYSVIAARDVRIVLSLPRAIFASNRRCEAGVQTNPCLQAPGTRNSCSKPGEPPELSSGRRCRASTQVWCGTRHYCSRTREVTWGLLAQWVLLRLFPLIASNESPLQAFFSGTDRVNCHPFQFTWFCYGVSVPDFVNAPCQLPWQILAITSVAPPFELHRRSIML